jgi:hypothetical protein
MMSLFYSQNKNHQLMQSSAKIDRETQKGLFSSSCVSGWHKIKKFCPYHKRKAYVIGT